jgi:hypothetical protein
MVGNRGPPSLHQGAPDGDRGSPNEQAQAAKGYKPVKYEAAHRQVIDILQRLARQSEGSIVDMNPRGSTE